MSKCPKCKGSGGGYYLVSQHDDETDWVDCEFCNGTGRYPPISKEEIKIEEREKNINKLLNKK
jgi:excinuclease UvrABC ATPase subunit